MDWKEAVKRSIDGLPTQCAVDGGAWREMFFWTVEARCCYDTIDGTSWVFGSRNEGITGRRWQFRATPEPTTPEAEPGPTPEPKVERNDVWKGPSADNGFELRYQRAGRGSHPLQCAPSDPDFIGYEYEGVSTPQLWVRMRPGNYRASDPTPAVVPTAVLFRRRPT